MGDHISSELSSNTGTLLLISCRRTLPASRIQLKQTIWLTSSLTFVEQDLIRTEPGTWLIHSSHCTEKHSSFAGVQMSKLANSSMFHFVLLRFIPCLLKRMKKKHKTN